MSKHFSMEEMCRSIKARQLGIQNVPDDVQRANINALCENCLEPLREEWGAPIQVSSGFRCARLNAAVGGETNSQHQKGEAADICVNSGVDGNARIGVIIARQGNFDQLIFENVGSRDLLAQWIHVSYRRDGKNRGQILKKVKGKNGYLGLTKRQLGL